MCVCTSDGSTASIPRTPFHSISNDVSKFVIGSSGIQIAPNHAMLDYRANAEGYFHGISHLIDEYQAVVSLPNLEPGMKVLDAGCGPGVIGKLAAETVGIENVWWIDAAPAMIEQIKRYTLTLFTKGCSAYTMQNND